MLASGPPLQQPFKLHSVNAPLPADATNPRHPPATLELSPCLPTPTRASARIDYALPHASPVRLRVYDVAGRVMTTLVDRVQPAGRFSAMLDGRPLGAGVYFVRLEAAGSTRTRRLVVAH